MSVLELIKKMKWIYIDVVSGKLVLRINCSDEDKAMCPVSRSKISEKVLCYVLGCSGCLEIQKVKK